MALFRMIEDNWNNLIGSNITHVVNAYHEDIFVLFTSEELKWNFLKDQSIDLASFNLADVPDAVFGTHRRDQKLRIPKGLNFHPHVRNNATDYLTVFSQNSDKSDHLICDNFAIRANRSYIVTPSGQIVQSKYRRWWQGGKSDIWEEEFGRRYKPKDEDDQDDDKKDKIIVELFRVAGLVAIIGTGICVYSKLRFVL